MIRTLAEPIAGALTALLVGSTSALAQATVDVQNEHPSVGTIMVWRTDGAGTPVELRAFASGTLIRERVMITAGHFTAPAKAMGTLPADVRVFASFSPSDAKNPDTWIPVVALTTHPSMPHCPPPPQCDPTDDSLVAPLEPGIADLGLVFLADAPEGIEPARLAEIGALETSAGAEMRIVGYGTLTPLEQDQPPDTSVWDGRRRVRRTTLRRLVDDIWALWSIPSYVCSGDSGGAIFLRRTNQADQLAGNVSDGGRDCRTHNNHVRLDTGAIQNWIADAIRERGGGRSP
jgi:hypothetical protein